MHKSTLAIAAACALFIPAIAFAGNFDGFYAGAQVGVADDLIQQNATQPTYYVAQYKTDSLAATNVTGTIFGGYGKAFSSLYLGGELFGTFGNGRYSYKEVDSSFPYSEGVRFGTQWGANLRPGYLFNDKALAYGLFGLHDVSMKSSSSYAGAALFDKQEAAFAIGAGVELSVAGPLTLRVDYTHTFIPDITVRDATGDVVTYKPSEDSFKIGAAYHF